MSRDFQPLFISPWNTLSSLKVFRKLFHFRKDIWSPKFACLLGHLNIFEKSFLLFIMGSKMGSKISWHCPFKPPGNCRCPAMCTASRCRRWSGTRRQCCWTPPTTGTWRPTATDTSSSYATSTNTVSACECVCTYVILYCIMYSTIFKLSSKTYFHLLLTVIYCKTKSWWDSNHSHSILLNIQTSDV